MSSSAAACFWTRSHATRPDRDTPTRIDRPATLPPTARLAAAAQNVGSACAQHSASSRATARLHPDEASFQPARRVGHSDAADCWARPAARLGRPEGRPRRLLWLARARTRDTDHGRLSSPRAVCVGRGWKEGGIASGGHVASWGRSRGSRGRRVPKPDDGVDDRRVARLTLDSDSVHAGESRTYQAGGTTRS